MEKFWRWLRARLLGEIERGLTAKLNGFHVRLAELTRDQQATQLLCSHMLMAQRQQRDDQVQANQRLHGAFETFHVEQQGWPRLTVETLRAWEAVAFSCGKVARDRELRGTGNEAAEELTWCEHYLREQGWPHPGDAVIRDLIALRHWLDRTKTVPV